MRHCLRRIVFSTAPQRIAVPCTRKGASQLLLRPGRRPFPVRSYADDAMDSGARQEEESAPTSIESTGTVPEDPDIITTEKPEIQEPPPSPDQGPPSKQSSRVSPDLPKSHRPARAIPFKLEETNNPKRAAAQLQKALTQTSLRKKLGWSEPLRGINPAYDMAIDYLRNDRKEKIQIIKKLESLIRQERENGASVERIQNLENERYRQLVLRDINIPQVRWRFKNGDIDLRKPAHQYLWRKNWESGQYVGRLMQRLTTMHVLPDSLPTLTPHVEFRLRFKDQKFPSRMKKRDFGWRDTEAGEMLPSLALLEPPRMEIIPHYKEWWLGRRYTVVMLDLDVPDVKHDTYRSKLHWMVRNIMASPVKTIIQTGNGETVVPYLPPHPYKGMHYHRYPIFVFEQPSKEREEELASHRRAQQTPKKNLENAKTPATTFDATSATEGIQVSALLTTIGSTSATTLRTYSTSSRSPVPTFDRDHFNIRAWANSNGLKPVGAHLVRCEWDEDVPKIIASLGLEERAFKKIRSEETTPFDFPHPGTYRRSS